LQNRPAITVESYTHDIADLAAPEKSLLARVVLSDPTVARLVCSQEKKFIEDE
jgi:hypothetical protein